MHPHTKESLLWGVIGALSFLVCLQGYELLADATVTVGVKTAVTPLVGVAAGAAAYFLRARLLPQRPPHESDPPSENESP